MQPLRPALSALAVLLCAAPFASAGQIVEITVTGTVEYDVIAAPPLGLVADGEPATLRFRVDSDSFVNSPSFPTRGYSIDKASFTLTFDSATVGLPVPYPAGQTPYFVIRNNDPGVDGFLLSADVDDPVGVPLSQVGSFGNLTQSFYVTYGASLLPSLNILDAVGTYDFTGLTVFNWTIDDGPANPMGMIFEQITIAVVPQAFTDMGGPLAGVAGNPKLTGSGNLAAGSNNALTLTRAAPSALAALFYSLSGGAAPFKGGILQPSPILGSVFLFTSVNGTIALPFVMPGGAPAGTPLWFQWAIQDAAAVQGVALSNALKGVTP
ncbi:MAG TPA: hypothetical protein VFD43_03220 [Planctomycetota bacterium]|nr:hypothetical protein [Planctomycetota bacterium]